MAVEQVNQDILKILGLEETDEIDMKSYKGFLREKLVEISMGKGNLSRDEELVVQSEFQRIKKQPDAVKVKKKKITAQNIGVTKASSSLVKYKKTSVQSKDRGQLALPAAPESVAGDKTVGDNLKSINKTLDKILKSIVSQGQTDRKRREKERVSGEKRRSQERESGLEKPLLVAKNLAKKIIAPFQGILDSVFRFLGFTFLGWLVGKFDQIEKWTSQNKEKIAVVTRFLKDWWPSILFAAGLFLTPFGAFVRGTVKMLRMFIPQIVRLIAAHPLLAAGAVTGLATFGAFQWKQQEDKKLIDQEAQKRNISPEAVQAEVDEAKKSPFAMIGEAFSNIGPMGYARGGSISGFNRGGNLNLSKYFSGIVGKNSGTTVGGFGKDTQAFPIEGGGSAVLQPGETVLQVGARERMIQETGHDPLAFNVGANANRPVNFTYNGGGVVGMQGGGILGALGRFLPGTGTVMAPRSGGPKDIRGVRQTQAGYQNKFLGMNIGNTFFPKGGRGEYSQAENRRYYERTGSHFVPTDFGPGYMPGIHGLYRPPRRGGSQAASSNARLNAAIQNARDITNMPGGGTYRPLVESAAGTAIKQQQYYDRLREVMRDAGMKGADESMNLYGKPIRRQGGGMVPQGPFTPLPQAGYVRPQGSFIPKPMLALPGPMPGTTIPFGYDPFKGLKGGGVVRRQGGGSIPRGTSQFGEIPLIRAAMNYGIKGPELAAFLSQMSHETGGFKWSRELGGGKGMGYSGGSKYHGRGYTQLTHDYNYKHFGEKLGVDLLKDPDILLRDPNLSARVAIEYWKEKVRPNVKDWNDVFSHSAAINYPSATSPNQIRGYDDRVKKFEYYNKNLKNIISRSLETKPQPKSKPKSPSFFENISGFFGNFFGGSAKASPIRKQGGGARFMKAGRVSTTTGVDIPGGKTGADTQYIPSLNLALQPGEDLYVVPKPAVPEMDAMVAQIDPTSNPAKIQSNIKTSVGPKVTFITLPNKVVSAPSKSGGFGSTGSPKLPEFSVTMENSMRMEVASALGIGDLV
jgi:putative chitinase